MAIKVKKVSDRAPSPGLPEDDCISSEGWVTVQLLLTDLALVIDGKARQICCLKYISADLKPDHRIFLTKKPPAIAEGIPYGD